LYNISPPPLSNLHKQDKEQGKDMYNKKNLSLSC
jgi:hypothetical protein